MADKEATVYIIDVGKSMGQKDQGRESTNLEWSMQYVWDKITTTVATGRKTAGVGVLGLRTDETDNMMGEEEGYEHISIFQPIQQTMMSDLKYLRDTIKPSKTRKGDALSALIVATQMIVLHCKRLKYIRKIVLVTDGLGQMDDDDAAPITGKIKEECIELLILGVDFDDAEFGFKEENKDPVKKANEKVLQEICEECDGTFATMALAIKERVGVPEVKKTRPVNSYKGLLTLGNPEKYDTAMCIDIERYPKVMVASAPTASSHVQGSGSAIPGPSAQSSATIQDGKESHQNGLVAVRNARTYVVDDPDAPGGKRDVEIEETEKGFAYGGTVVPVSTSDMDVINLETIATMDIIGFVDGGLYEPYMSMSKSNLIIARKADDKAAMALSSLIHAMFERETYAVARFVPKDKKAPVLLLLAPCIDTDNGLEYLVDVELPFAEDVRHYVFPPLDRVVTVGRKKLIQHRNLPSEGLLQAMSDYVDAMDISTFGEDDEGNPTEYARMEEAFSPKLHRINQALKFRAVNETDEVPPPWESIIRYSNPPTKLLEQAQAAIDDVIRTSDIKKVPPKQKGRKRGRVIDKPLSGLDVDELLGREKRAKISDENAIPEFKQLLATIEEMDEVKKAMDQMGAIVRQFIERSVGDSGYNRALEMMRVMKEEMTDFEFPDLYNEFVRDLKRKILKGELGQGRDEMWYKIRTTRLGLIDSKTSDVSDVTPEEAFEFSKQKL
ncbi:SPOC domain-like protein [Tothia fuscella]|uniref:ATP-dependent DNA helicase II subunit 2 n=1 Tax=Tothia fuscella TaxID=1048955 RepID=A0A9P4U1R4_9PEZI|nr:SPOC domain-like protein [Tothia fuscella]